MGTEEFATGVLAGELHHAVESGSFERVPALAKAYGQAVAKALFEVTSSEDQASIADQARSFLENHLHLARVMRAHISAQMAAACRLASYKGSPTLESTWFVNG